MTIITIESHLHLARSAKVGEESYRSLRHSPDLFLFAGRTKAESQK